MMFANRRRLVFVAAAAAGVGALGIHVSARPAAVAERTIRITARRFDYSPAEITLKKGEPVVLELVTDDVLMGFSLPGLKVREDLVPGKIARVRLTPDRIGAYIFVCDVFCGGGHEAMHGTLTVVD